MLIATQPVPMRYLPYWSDRAYRRDGSDRSDGTYGRDRNRRDWCNGPHRCNGTYRRHRAGYIRETNISYSVKRQSSGIKSRCFLKSFEC